MLTIAPTAAVFLYRIANIGYENGGETACETGAL